MRQFSPILPVTTTMHMGLAPCGALHGARAASSCAGVPLELIRIACAHHTKGAMSWWDSTNTVQSILRSILGNALPGRVQHGSLTAAQWQRLANSQ